MILNTELLIMLEEAALSYFRYCSGTYTDGLRKIQNTLSQKNRESNTEFSEYEPRVI